MPLIAPAATGSARMGALDCLGFADGKDTLILNGLFFLTPVGILLSDVLLAD